MSFTTLKIVQNAILKALFDTVFVTRIYQHVHLKQQASVFMVSSVVFYRSLLHGAQGGIECKHAVGTAERE